MGRDCEPRARPHRRPTPPAQRDRPPLQTELHEAGQSGRRAAGARRRRTVLPPPLPPPLAGSPRSAAPLLQARSSGAGPITGAGATAARTPQRLALGSRGCTVDPAGPSPAQPGAPQPRASPPPPRGTRGADMNTSDAKEYLARREIPQLFEVRGRRGSRGPGRAPRGWGEQLRPVLPSWCGAWKWGTRRGSPFPRLPGPWPMAGSEARTPQIKFPSSERVPGAGWPRAPLSSGPRVSCRHRPGRARGSKGQARGAHGGRAWVKDT